MDMTLQYYNQPHITVDEQIQLLRSEGLLFENESRAKHLLNHISMFRLKSYLKPFRQHNSRCFKSGATFDKHIHSINSIPSYYLIGEIVNVRADNSILGEDGNLDLTKLQPIIYDPIHNH